MKKLVLMFCFFTVWCSYQAQSKFEYKDRVIVDLFHCNWLHHDDSLKTKWYSRGLSASYNVLFPVWKDAVVFSVGLGISNYNFYTNSYFVNSPQLTSTVAGQTYTEPFTYADNKKPKANKLAVTYLDLPFELRFLGKKDKMGQQIKFSVGGQFGYKYDLHTRMKNSVGKYKDFIFPNAEKWRYGVHVRIGYGRNQFYGFYSLNTVFQENKGIYLRPIAFGYSYTLY